MLQLAPSPGLLQHVALSCRRSAGRARAKAHPTTHFMQRPTHERITLAARGSLRMRHVYVCVYVRVGPPCKPSARPPRLPGCRCRWLQTMPALRLIDWAVNTAPWATTEAYTQVGAGGRAGSPGQGRGAAAQQRNTPPCVCGWMRWAHVLHSLLMCGTWRRPAGRTAAWPAQHAALCALSPSRCIPVPPFPPCSPRATHTRTRACLCVRVQATRGDTRGSTWLKMEGPYDPTGRGHGFCFMADVQHMAAKPELKKQQPQVPGACVQRIGRMLLLLRARK